MMDVPATIPTRYSGILFRSRAEARWAVMFHKLKLRFSYEDEGFQLQSFWYLPDFWLPEWRAFAEVKGALHQWDAVALGKASELAKESGRPVLLLDEIDPQRPYVDALAQDGCRFFVDLPRSILEGRLWFEADQVEGREIWSLGDDVRWEEAASRAALWQFDRRGPGA